MNSGKVYLVGGGPGTPELITEKGAQILRRAQVVFYDRSLAVLVAQYVPREAERIAVDQEKGWASEAFLPQLLQKVYTVSQVVCVVEGDPYLSGLYNIVEGEILSRGIPFEVVPGIPAMLAAPSYVGLSTAGKREELAQRNASIIQSRWVLDKGMEIVSRTNCELSSLCRQLLHEGKAPNTSITLVDHVTRPEQQVISGTLDEWANEMEGKTLSATSVLLIGNRAKVEERLSWFSQKPLFGRRILVTRAREQARELSQKIEELGGEALEFPVIRIAPPAQINPLDAALKELSSFQWVIFTSVNGVKFFFQRLHQLKIDVRKMRAKVAAVGPKTAAALEDKGIQVDLIPQEYVAESLLEALLPVIRSGDRVLLPRANIARNVLPKGLSQAGCEVVDVDAYDTCGTEENAEEVAHFLAEGRLHVLTFTSSSTVHYFVKAMEKACTDWRHLVSRAQIACIGPITKRTAEAYGLHVDIMATSYTISGLVKALTQLPHRK